MAFATGGLGLATAGIMVLMALSSIQAFLMISQQSSTNTRNQLSLAADLDPATAGDAALALAAEGIGALTGDDPSGPAVAAGQLGGDTTGHPTAPVTRDQTVVVHGIRVHRSIAEDVRDLIDAAAADGITLAGWGWRDHQTQIRLRREHCGTTEYAIYRMPSSQCSPPTARPGRSQHERGLAIDFTYNGGSISSRSNTGFRWLAANAATYGLQNLASEPWHWSTTGR
ncbi:MAG: M15 family metallopeptidase [Actinomycetota bacterium]